MELPSASLANGSYSANTEFSAALRSLVITLSRTVMQGSWPSLTWLSVWIAASISVTLSHGATTWNSLLRLPTTRCPARAARWRGTRGTRGSTGLRAGWFPGSCSCGSWTATGA